MALQGGFALCADGLEPISFFHFFLDLRRPCPQYVIRTGLDRHVAVCTVWTSISQCAGHSSLRVQFCTVEAPQKQAQGTRWPDTLQYPKPMFHCLDFVGVVGLFPPRPLPVEDRTQLV